MRRVLHWVLALLIVAVGVEGYRLYRVHGLNAAIATGEAFPEEPEHGEVLFARAYFLDRKGEPQAALAIYQRLQNEGEPEQKLAAQYNTANILLRQAAEFSNSEAAGQALPLFELAKESYRELLRAEPSHWDAKYNFERALRLSPEAVGDSGAERGPGAERAVTTMRGFTLGLP